MLFFHVLRNQEVSLLVKWSIAIRVLYVGEETLD